MIVDNNRNPIYPTVRTIQGITGTADEQRILDFLQGAIYAHCFYSPDSWFSIWDFLGGVNGDWNDAPLQKLYDMYISNGKSPDDAKDGARKDAGNLLKKAIIKEPRRDFITEKDMADKAKPRQYRWVK
jgi:hypothetical protein